MKLDFDFSVDLLIAQFSSSRKISVGDHILESVCATVVTHVMGVGVNRRNDFRRIRENGSALICWILIIV